jgi:hypothetical protein
MAGNGLETVNDRSTSDDEENGVAPLPETFMSEN